VGALLSFLGLLVTLPDAAMLLFRQVQLRASVVTQWVRRVIFRREGRVVSVGGNLHAGFGVRAEATVTWPPVTDGLPINEKIRMLLDRTELLQLEFKEVQKAVVETREAAKVQLDTVDARLTGRLDEMLADITESGLRQTRFNAHGLVITPLGILASTADPGLIPTWAWFAGVLVIGAWAALQIGLNIQEAHRQSR
jgi:hypothetical protein